MTLVKLFNLITPLLPHLYNGDVVDRSHITLDVADDDYFVFGPFSTEPGSN